LADGTFAGAIVGTSHDVHAEYIYQNGARIALRDPGALNVREHRGSPIYIFALNDAESGMGPVPEQWFQGKCSFYSIALRDD
jgi:hypothetical protein